MLVPKKLVQTLLKAKRIVITSHVNPEGDALGSALALAMGLQAIGKQVEVICHSGVPNRYNFLPSFETIQTTTPRKPDLLVLLDCCELDRADLPKALKEDIPPIAIIDHHPQKSDNENKNCVAWIEPKASATGEMVASLLKELKVKMNKEMATCLYAALVTDTGAFHFSNTTPKALRLAAKLLTYKFDHQEVVYRVMDSRSFLATQLLAKTLSKAKFDPKFGLCWSVLSIKDFNQTKTRDEDTENFVNFLRAVEGVRVAILFRQVEDNLVKVSLRSKEGIDVSKIARQLGGGGHLSAAGCRLKLPLPQVVRKVLQSTRMALTNKI